MASDTDSMLMDLLTKTGYLDTFAVLSIVSPAHLSRIARLIGKSKSTVLKTIDNMMAEQPSLIEVDEDKTLNTRGVKKFYRLSDAGSSINLVLDPELQTAPMSIPDDIYKVQVLEEATKNLAEYGEEKMLAYFTLGSQLNYYFQRASAHAYIEHARQYFKDRDVTHAAPIPYGSFHSSLKRISVSSFSQVHRIKLLTQRYLTDLSHLEQELQQENQAKIDSGDLAADDLDVQIVFTNLNPVLDTA